MYSRVCFLCSICQHGPSIPAYIPQCVCVCKCVYVCVCPATATNGFILREQVERKEQRLRGESSSSADGSCSHFLRIGCRALAGFSFARRY